jgi:hypothetical protein
MRKGWKRDAENARRPGAIGVQRLEGVDDDRLELAAAVAMANERRHVVNLNRVGNRTYASLPRLQKKGLVIISPVQRVRVSGSREDLVGFGARRSERPEPALRARSEVSLDHRRHLTDVRLLLGGRKRSLKRGVVATMGHDAPSQLLHLGQNLGMAPAHLAVDDRGAGMPAAARCSISLQTPTRLP